MFTDLTSYILAQFPTAKSLSPQAFSCQGITYLIGKLSELDQLRDYAKEHTELLRPIVPVLIRDCQISSNVPKNWLLLDQDGLFVVQGQTIMAQAKPSNVSGFKASNYVVDDHCSFCLLGISPCPFHLKI